MLEWIHILNAMSGFFFTKEHRTIKAKFSVHSNEGISQVIPLPFRHTVILLYVAPCSPTGRWKQDFEMFLICHSILIRFEGDCMVIQLFSKLFSL